MVVVTISTKIRCVAVLRALHLVVADGESAKQHELHSMWQWKLAVLCMQMKLTVCGEKVVHQLFCAFFYGNIIIFD